MLCCYRSSFISCFFLVLAIISQQGVKPVLSWLPPNPSLSQRVSSAYSNTRIVAAASLTSSTTLFATSTTEKSPSVKAQRDLTSSNSSNSNNNNNNNMVVSTRSALNARTQKLFRGQTVLITGASSGLGRCIALELAGCGAHTLVLSARNQDALNLVAQECQDAFHVANHQASLSTTTSTTTFTSSDPLVQQHQQQQQISDMQIHVVPCDLSQPDDVTKLASQALELCHGRIDVLINNGGISSRSRFVDTQLAVDEQLMQVNFFSGAALAKAIVPGMIQRGFGKILWISSVQGLMGIPHRTSYAASKFAVQGYCEALRAELTCQGVDVHIASPGYIRTNLSKSAVTGDGTLHGQVDAATAKGALPETVARYILNKVAAGTAEFVVAATLSAKVAIWLRFLCPSLLRFMLVKRYQKTEKGKE